MRRAAALGRSGRALVAALLLCGGRAAGAEVVGQLEQRIGLVTITNYITNNDNAIYNSATFALVGTYENILKAIRDHNPAYAGMTLLEIGGRVWSGPESGSNVVDNGWTATYDVATGKVKAKGLVPYGDYELERSADLEGWDRVGLIEAPAGVSPGVCSEYEWQEAKAAGGRMYYRLKWVEP